MRSAEANRPANSQLAMSSSRSRAKSQGIQQLLAPVADSTLSPLVAQDWR
jgi:hypothetical protein